MASIEKALHLECPPVKCVLVWLNAISSINQKPNSDMLAISTNIAIVNHIDIYKWLNKGKSHEH